MFNLTPVSRVLLLAHSWCEAADVFVLQQDIEMFWSIKTASAIFNAINALIRGINLMSGEDVIGYDFESIDGAYHMPWYFVKQADDIRQLYFSMNNTEVSAPGEKIAELLYWTKVWSISLIQADTDAALCYIYNKRPDSFLEDCSSEEIIERNSDLFNITRA